MRKVILVLVVLILCVPLPLSILKFILPNIKMEITLYGSLQAPAWPVPSVRNIFNGTFQNNFEKSFNFKMIGRSAMTHIYNEVLYRFFNSINNDKLIMGKDKYLYEFTYINAYLIEPDDDKKNELFEKLTMLALLQLKMEEMGKSLIVLITPSKVSVYPEYLPGDLSRYISMKDRGEYAPNFYEYFVSRVSETSLKYFDFHENFLELKENGTDIFTKGGTHWAGPAVTAFFSELLNFINKDTEKKIGTIQTVKEEPIWGNAFTVDDDLELLSNIFPAYNNLPGKIRKLIFFISPFYNHIFPRSQFYSYHMESLSYPTDYRPSVFVCGGSFNYNWLFMVYGLINWVTQGDNHIFGTTEVSWYNSYIMKFPEDIRIAETTDDFYSILDKDIIIIEINEAAINPSAPQFTFAKNLLDFIEGEKK
jgi:hypothetical protein